MIGYISRPALVARIVAAVFAVLLSCPAGPAAATLDEQAAAWAAADAQALGRAAPRLAEMAVDEPFAAMDRRVTAYADWVYGWLASLLTAWDLAYAGAAEAGREIALGQFPGTGILHDRLALVVQQRFDSIVILPEQTDQALIEGWTRAMMKLSGFDARLTAERRQRIEHLAAGLGADPAAALQRYGTPLLEPAHLGGGPPERLAGRSLEDIEQGAGGTADRVLVRSLRPLATRAISVTTRVLLAPIAGSVLASPVAGAGGLVAAAATMAAVSSGVWGLDYALNAADSALTRPGFEADLRTLVRDARGVAAGIVRRHAEAATCGALAAAVRGAVAACDKQPDPLQPAVLQPVVAAGGRSG